MKIAGGMFGFPERLVASQADTPHFMRDPKLLFLSARCGIKYLIDSLNPTQVWMPSYLCGTMLEAVDRHVTELKFYEVGYDLEVVSDQWVDSVPSGSLVVVIDYFGFPCDPTLIARIQARGSLVLEDASQAMLSAHVGRHSDYVLYSPRKTVGVPDGGILRSVRGSAFPPACLLQPPQEWWLMAAEACLERREFDRFGGERRWFKLFRELEAVHPLGPYQMSQLTELLLEKGFAYQEIRKARRANYQSLCDGLLGQYALFPALDAETVPLGFPIRVEARDQVREALFAEEIFPPVHWQLGDYVPKQFIDSHRLSAHIMTIPCDQRLGPDDVLRIRDAVHQALIANL